MQWGNAAAVDNHHRHWFLAVGGRRMIHGPAVDTSSQVPLPHTPRFSFYLFMIVITCDLQRRPVEFRDGGGVGGGVPQNPHQTYDTINPQPIHCHFCQYSVFITSLIRSMGVYCAFLRETGWEGCIVGRICHEKKKKKSRGHDRFLPLIFFLLNALRCRRG